MIHFSKKVIYTVAAAALTLCAFSINPTNDPVFKNLDKSVKPGDDFFQYANGKWLKDNPQKVAALNEWIGKTERGF